MRQHTLLAVTAVLALHGSLAAAADHVDYSGFWKESCSDPYGLQIKPYRNGTYTITFCGPGSRHCGEDADLRSATPIEGDPLYEVLGPEMMRIRYAEGYAPTYVRCTSELHPVLEYSAADQTEEQRGMIFALLIHLTYLLVASAAYALLYRRTHSLPTTRRSLYRTGLAAALFAPGLLWSWPFVSPTFALLALAVFLIDLSQASTALLPAQLFYSLGPMLVMWALLLALVYLWHKRRPRNG